MRLLVAPERLGPDAGALETAHALAVGARDAAFSTGKGVDVDLCPLTRGEPGCVDALLVATDGEERTVNVAGPLGDPVEARWGVLRPRTLGEEGGLADAVIQSLGGLLLGVPFPLREEERSEMPGSPGPLAFLDLSSVIGPALVDPATHEPQLAGSVGVGELIDAAVNAGHDRIVLAAGEGAALDAGIGALGALGVVFRDENEQEIDVTDSLDLLDVATIDSSGLRPALRRGRVALAIAAANERRFIGQTSPVWTLRERGAWHPDQPNIFHDAFDRFARLLGEHDERHPASRQAGAGAAGGLAFSFSALLGAPIVPGFDLTRQVVGLDQRVRRADAVLAAMGPREVDARSDPITTLLALAAEHDKPLLLLDTRPAEDASRSLETGERVRIVHTPPLHRLAHGLGDLVVEADRLVTAALTAKSDRKKSPFPDAT